MVAASDPTSATPEDVLGLPTEPSPDQGEINKALADASDITKYAEKALKALEDEDYETVKSYLGDIESGSSNVLSAMNQMESALSSYDDWGNAWKNEAMSRPTEPIEVLDKVHFHCLRELAEIQADDNFSDKDERLLAAIAKRGVKDIEEVAVLLSVGKVRGESLSKERRERANETQTKLRKISGDKGRAFF